MCSFHNTPIWCSLHSGFHSLLLWITQYLDNKTPSTWIVLHGYFFKLLSSSEINVGRKWENGLSSCLQAQEEVAIRRGWGGLLDGKQTRTPLALVAPNLLGGRMISYATRYAGLGLSTTHEFRTGCWVWCLAIWMVGLTDTDLPCQALSISCYGGPTPDHPPCVSGGEWSCRTWKTIDGRRDCRRHPWYVLLCLIIWQKGSSDFPKNVL